MTKTRHPDETHFYHEIFLTRVLFLCPSAAKYRERVTKELELIYTFGYEACFLHVLDILNKAQGMPYLIRGSAAGSLVRLHPSPRTRPNIYQHAPDISQNRQH